MKSDVTGKPLGTDLNKLRALADADMLYSPRKNGPPTATRDVQGVATVGIVLLPRHVDGLDPLAFAPGADAAT